jgi:chaperone required for assembly of F1-ATPase
MRDELTKSNPEPSPAASDPGASPSGLSGQQSQKIALRKRFYTRAEAAPFEDQFAVLLDGKPVLTPAKNRLALPTLAAAEDVAAEWQAQKDEIDPTTLPLTRILNAALDGVARAMDAVAAEIVKYAGSDLICYRAGEPESLVKLQAEIWNPILAFVEGEIGARFVLVEGVMHVAQPPGALTAVREKIERMTALGRGSAIGLACLDVLTTLSGSALIAIARARGAITLEQAWTAAHVDEDFQMRLWGVDAEAMARRAQRFTEIAAADRLWQLVQP